MAESEHKKPTLGCLYLCIVALMTSILLFINIACVGAIVSRNRELLDAIYPDPTGVVQFRIAQALQIFLPVIITFCQFWIFDRIIDRAFGYGIRKKKEVSA